MNLKKILLSGILVLSMVFTMSASVFADEVVKEESTEKVYTIEIEGKYQPRWNDHVKSVTSYQSLGLTLPPSASGWSTPVKFNFNSVPNNAKVKKIEFKHGHGQTGGQNMLGAIVGTQLELTNPDYVTKTVVWSNSSFKNISGFFHDDVKGSWSARMQGQNIASATGDYWQDLMFWDTVSYKSPKLIITYILD